MTTTVPLTAHPADKIPDVVFERLADIQGKRAARLENYLRGQRDIPPQGQDYVHVLRKSRGQLVAHSVGNMGVTQFRWANTSHDGPEFEGRGHSGLRASMKRYPDWSKRYSAKQLKDEIGAPMLVPGREWERDLDVYYRHLQREGVI